MKKRSLLLPLLATFAMSGCYVDLGFIKFGTKPESNENNNNDNENETDTTASVVSVSVTGSKSTLYLGSTLQLSANVEVKNGASKNVTWSSSDNNVATVSTNGLVTAKAEGTVTITATSAVDTTKKGEVTINVIKGTWAKSDLDLIEEYIGEEIPFFETPSGFAWTDEYMEYGYSFCIEGSGNHLSEIVASMKAAGINFVGEEIDDYGDPYYVFELETKNPENSDYVVTLEVYTYEDDDSKTYTTVDVYLSAKTYNAWPTEIIASKLAEFSFGDKVSLPTFSTTEKFTYSVTIEESVDEMTYVHIAAIGGYDSKITAADYVDLMDETKYKIEDYGDGSFMLQAKDKSHTIYVYDQELEYDIDWETFEFLSAGGFEIIVVEYQPEITIEINENYEMITVGGELQLTLTKGEDVDPAAQVTWESSNDEVATVSDGKVTGVAKGEVKISARIGEVEAETTVYVVDEVRTAFTDTEVAEFNKLGEGIIVPFNKYMESVKYDAEYKTVEVTGKVVSYESLVEYFDALVADSWAYVDQAILDKADEYDSTREEMLALLFSENYCFEFEKAFNFGGVEHLISASIACIEEYEGEFYYSSEGNLLVTLCDYYIYNPAEAANAVKELAVEELGFEVAPEFPEDIAATRFFVAFNEADELYPADVAFYAYGFTGTESDIVTKLQGLGYEASLTDEGIDAFSADETTEIYGGVLGEGTLVLWLVNLSGGQTFECEETVSFSEQGYANGEDVAKFEFVNGAVLTFDAGTNNIGPKWYDGGSAIRCYGSNTITFTAPEGCTITEIELTFSEDGTSKNPITVNAGSYVDGAETGVWTGEENEVVFTVGGTSGNRRLAGVHIEYTGVEGSGGGTTSD